MEVGLAMSDGSFVAPGFLKKNRVAYPLEDNRLVSQLKQYLTKTLTIIGGISLSYTESGLRALSLSWRATFVCDCVRGMI